MATALPIAFSGPSDNNDLIMGSGSFSGQNGSFNAASYTRRYVGSPISWRAGSFGARFPHGSPSAQLFSSLE